jgi:hypothetical protein
MEQPFIVVLDAFMPFSMGPSQLRREEFGNERDAARRLAHISVQHAARREGPRGVPEVAG